jgi:hypothetical protein
MGIRLKSHPAPTIYAAEIAKKKRNKAEKKNNVILPDIHIFPALSKRSAASKSPHTDPGLRLRGTLSSAGRTLLH